MLLILIGALGTTVLVLRAGERVEVVKITEPVPAGKRVPASAIESVMVAKDSGVQYVTWDQRDLLNTDYWAATDLTEGSLLVGSMLTGKSDISDGKALVGLNLKDGQYPAGLKAGDTVALYRVGSDAAKSGSGNSDSTDSGSTGDNNLLVQNARVSEVASADGGETISSGDLPVSVLVSQDEAQLVTPAASVQEVAVVRVPKSAN
ncbi:hypothetical protein [Streptomyces sp. NPDC051776]|uniref:hypothetical protein n=1 Tax=Streptomyces sp. NPDC051776 TaxID=3155414 RepID=UPI003438A708